MSSLERRLHPLRPLPRISAESCSLALLFATALCACSSNLETDDPLNLGAGSAVGLGTGASGTGGNFSPNPTGGDTSSGGTLIASGGADSTGGNLGSGGAAAGGSAPGTGGSEPEGSCMPPTIGSQGSNPLFANIFTADPAALVHDCTFYITAGRDQGTSGFDLREWYVLSSTDMVNWTENGGPIMQLSTFKWANANAWAGQMVERNGKFYWYVPVNESAGGMAIGVAVADSPLGPFIDALGKPLVNDAIEMSEFGYNDAGQTAYTIDPTVFVDDDGQAYLMYGGFWRMVIVPLADDMISFDGEMVENTPPGFFEAPYLAKREGIYYMVYAADKNPATIDYVTATSPTGPWQNRGRILDILPKGAGQDEPTSHPAIAEFAGEWYLVYHLSNGPGGGTYKRQVAVDKLEFKADGSIEKVIPSSGLSF